MDIKHGLCNGTRLKVLKMHKNILELEVLNGFFKSKRVLLPRIDLINEIDFPFKFKRRQFPIRLAFSMTINKSQGQTFDKVGLFLEKQVFTHGQLYVACSRVRKFEKLKIFAKTKLITNIVFKEVL